MVEKNILEAWVNAQSNDERESVVNAEVIDRLKNFSPEDHADYAVSRHEIAYMMHTQTQRAITQEITNQLNG